MGQPQQREGLWHCHRPHAVWGLRSSVGGQSLAHTGHLTVSHASCLVQQLALWPASHLALHVWDIWHHHALLAQVLSGLWVPPCAEGICNYLPAGGFSYTKNLSTSGSPCLWEQQVILSLCGWPGQAVRSLAARALGPVELSQALSVLGMWRHGLALWPALVLDNCNTVLFLKASQRECDLDILKDGPSLPSIGLLYSMRGSERLFHIFCLADAQLARLMSSVSITKHAKV